MDLKIKDTKRIVGNGTLGFGDIIGISENIPTTVKLNVVWKNSSDRQAVVALREQIWVVDKITGSIYKMDPLPEDMEGYFIDKLVPMGDGCHLICLKYDGGEYYKKAVKLDSKISFKDGNLVIKRD